MIAIMQKVPNLKYTYIGIELFNQFDPLLLLDMNEDVDNDVNTNLEMIIHTDSSVWIWNVSTILKEKKKHGIWAKVKYLFLSCISTTLKLDYKDGKREFRSGLEL
jgi:hypothetical protein